MSDTAATSTGWRTRIESLLALALSRSSAAVTISSVLANHHSKTDGNITGSGTPIALWTDDAAIVSTPGAPGNFEISAGASVVVSAVGQAIEFQVLRNGSNVGPNVTAVSVSEGGTPVASGSLAFIDEPGPGTYTYALQILNDGVGAHNIVSLTSSGSSASAFLNISETL